MSVRFDETATFFEGRLYIDVAYTHEQGVVNITAGFDGFDSQTTTLKRGQVYVFNFGILFELRLFKIDSYSVNIQVGEKASSTISSVLADSTIFDVSDSEEKFSPTEIRELKSRLDSMEHELHSMYKFTKEEAEFTRTAFELLNKKLDSSSKTSWRQTAYSVVTSVACTVAPQHFDQIANLYGTAKEHAVPILEMLAK